MDLPRRSAGWNSASSHKDSHKPSESLELESRSGCSLRWDLWLCCSSSCLQKHHQAFVIRYVFRTKKLVKYALLLKDGLHIVKKQKDLWHHKITTRSCAIRSRQWNGLLPTKMYTAICFLVFKVPLPGLMKWNFPHLLLSPTCDPRKGKRIPHCLSYRLPQGHIHWHKTFHWGKRQTGATLFTFPSSKHPQMLWLSIHTETSGFSINFLWFTGACWGGRKD